MQDNLETQIINQLNELTNVRKQLRQLKGSRLSLIDPNSGQGRILSILKTDAPISQKDLVAQLPMKPQSASEIIHKLESKKYIERQPSPSDKRAFIIKLTLEGQAATKRISQDEIAHIDVLTTPEQQKLSGLLDKLITSFNDENQTAKDNFGVNLFGNKKEK